MAQVLIGKELPNLKITLGNDRDGMEEGELSENEASSEKVVEINESKDGKVTIMRKFESPLHKQKIYENKGGAFVTGLDLSSEVVLKKLEDRASRFGLTEGPKQHITQDEIDALYKSLQVDEQSSSSKSKNIRLDTIHMRGVEDMNTNEVFDYFKEFGPASVEWINDYACNVVWMDELSAARALLSLSKLLVVKKKSQVSSKDCKKEPEKDGTDVESNQNNTANVENAEEKAHEMEEVIIMSGDSSDEEEDDEDRLVGFKHKHEGNPCSSVDSVMEIDSTEDAAEQNIIDESAVDVPVPPGQWRLGIPHAKAKAILLRFATKDDKKLPGAEKRSEYYKKYGNPNYGGLRGLISKSRKRKIQASKHRELVDYLSSKSESTKSEDKADVSGNTNKPKRMRMRMYADDEEKKIERRQASERYSFFRLFENCLNMGNSSVHQRLGKREFLSRTLNIEPEEEESSNEEQDSEPESKTQELPRNKTSKFQIWTQLAESMSKEPEVDEFPTRSYSQNQSSDLRNKIHSSVNRRYKSDVEPHDLRSKLEHMRKNDNMKHRSPLLIKINNESENSVDSV